MLLGTRVTEAFGIVGLIFCGASGVWHMMGQDRRKDPRPKDCKYGEILHYKKKLSNC
jgi:hypothetical protein